jgi:catechol 2,3-dioxygenase-like lactoylglutathione lyase family enzyme
MRVRAIDFVVVNVSDVARSVRFYRDTLGVDVPLWEDSPRWQEFQTAPVAFALREDKGGPGVNAAIALAVEDVAGAVEELRGKGVPILLEPRESEVCFSALIQDPDGNLLLLHRRKDGTAG